MTNRTLKDAAACERAGRKSSWLALRELVPTGVAHVMQTAARHGYTSRDSDWCNLGQGQPEVGELAGAPARPEAVLLESADCAYGPAAGISQLRQAVADHYNRLFRRQHHSQYMAANVAIAAGGRLALWRLFSALACVRVGYRAPDYATYEDVLASHAHHVTPVHVLTCEHRRLDPDRLARAIREERLDAYLLSNPCNPTGQLLEGEALQACVATAREANCLLVLDEFYSHFIYTADGGPAPGPISAAEYVGDIERDPVLIIDGLTKNFRCPGWRLGWILGPSELIERITCAAASIDGGAPVPIQRAAVELLAAQRADRESCALRTTFACKRQLMLELLTQMGVSVPYPPRGSFYVWGNIAGLPAPYNDAEALFRAALERKVVIVPGRYFDLNPGARRAPDPTYRHWVRFSFGASEQTIKSGVSRLQELVGRG